MIFKIIFIKILKDIWGLPPFKRRSPPMKTKITCPKCGHEKIVKFGKYPRTGEQKYRCKRCLCQFINGHIWKEKTRYPFTKYALCPKCGAHLEQRKNNKNTIQLRCSNRFFCRYFFNLALPSLKERFFLPIKSKFKNSLVIIGTIQL